MRVLSNIYWEYRLPADNRRMGRPLRMEIIVYDDQLLARAIGQFVYVLTRYHPTDKLCEEFALRIFSDAEEQSATVYFGVAS